MDKEGVTSIITSSRFLIALSGRPAPMDCPGGELAITSDEIFSLEKPPGKTLCVGASFISLESASVFAGLGNDVTVAVRSRVLRGLDRECVDRLCHIMKDAGVKFKMAVTLSKLEKVQDEKIKVTFSDGTDEVYDTVVSAIGRLANTDKLGLDNVGIKTNPTNQKIPTRLEQTATPNIYAIGDVIEVGQNLCAAMVVASCSVCHHDCFSFLFCTIGRDVLN
jgi:thioredoxin reductase (NADPH)